MRGAMPAERASVRGAMPAEPILADDRKRKAAIALSASLCST